MALPPTPLTRLARAIALGVCALALSAPAAAEPVRPVRLKDYVRRAWNTGEGLPQSSVRAIAGSDQGYLWIATSEGLVRFESRPGAGSIFDFTARFGRASTAVESR